MRSELDKSFAGAGTDWAFYEEEETYQDNKVHVTLPYDYLTTEQRKKLSGPVKTYRLEETNMQDKNVGARVNVSIGQKKVERVLHEDLDGLYIEYKNDRVRVKPELNQFGENNTNSYIKIIGGRKNDN